jgi:hypothetical protein
VRRQPQPNPLAFHSLLRSNCSLSAASQRLKAPRTTRGEYASLALLVATYRTSWVEGSSSLRSFRSSLTLRTDVQNCTQKRPDSSPQGRVHRPARRLHDQSSPVQERGNKIDVPAADDFAKHLISVLDSVRAEGATTLRALSAPLNRNRPVAVATGIRHRSQIYCPGCRRSLLIGGNLASL